MPELTPECPFYEHTGDAPLCAEQCIDVLADHGPGRRSAPPQDLGHGLAAFRRPIPRPRRRPDPQDRPFDAARIGLRDHDRPVEQRSTTTLIKDIRDHLPVPPNYLPDAQERAYVISSSYEELERRGVQADLVVRCGVAPRAEAGMLFALLPADILNTAGIPNTELENLPQPDPAWLELLQAARAADGSDSQTLFQYATTGSFGRRLRRWMAIAPIDDIINWRPPSTSDFLAPVEASPWSGEQTRRATWLVERFTATYLDEWSTDSLEMEWGYLHGEEPGCCPAPSMRERPTDSAEVARLLADRHHEVWKQHPKVRMERQFSAQDFTRAAAENLAAGRQEAAAAIYAAVLRLSPDSPAAHNNYGFCILPSDTDRSLDHLEQASSVLSGAAIELTNATNRVLALHLLGRDEDAIALAEAAFKIPGPHPHSFLWLHGPAPLRITEPVDPRRHLEQLYEHIKSSIRWDTCRTATASAD